jgi:hypothetical protein
MSNSLDTPGLPVLTAAAIAALLVTVNYTPPDNLFSITGSVNTNRILAFEVDTQAAGTLTLDVGPQTASRRLTTIPSGSQPTLRSETCLPCWRSSTI